MCLSWMKSNETFDGIVGKIELFIHSNTVWHNDNKSIIITTDDNHTVIINDKDTDVCDNDYSDNNNNYNYNNNNDKWQRKQPQFIESSWIADNRIVYPQLDLW